MARRSKSSPMDDLTDLVARLPWWAGVALAAVFYFVLHRAAEQPVAVAVAPGQVGSAMVRSMWLAFATIGQYLVPLCCLAGAGISAFKRYQRQRLVGEVTRNEVGGAVAQMSWREFELLISEAFRLQGYRVEEAGGGGADGGVDLVLRRGGEIQLVQCKHWRAYNVGVEVIRELYGVMTARGAAAGFVVTSGKFTPAATEFATGRNLTLIDGPRLDTMIRKAQASHAVPKQADQPAGPGTAAHREAESPARVAPTVPMPRSAPTAFPQQAAVPTCPRCGSSMLLRKARRGASAGADFWGCSTYPACKGTRPKD